MFHGSPHKLTHLRAGSWVTPHREDAAVFGVPWSSDELVSAGQGGGRPPKTLRFKGEAPEDHPVYIYRVLDGDVRPASTNTGADYDWNHQVHGKAKVELVETIPSWKEELMPFKSKRQQRAMFAGAIPGLDKSDAKEWAKETNFKKLPERAPKEKGKPTMRSKESSLFFGLEDTLGEVFKSAAAINLNAGSAFARADKLRTAATRNAARQKKLFRAATDPSKSEAYQNRAQGLVSRTFNRSTDLNREAGKQRNLAMPR